MRLLPLILVAAAGLLLLPAAARRRARPPLASPPPEAAVVSPTAVPAAPGAPVSPGKSERAFEEFDPRNFDRSTTIDNPWFPLTPGTQFVYEGFAVDAGERIPHRVVFTVTDLTKVIQGVRAVVVADKDYRADQLVESELTFFGQDNAGNVWHLGQYRETYDETEFVGGRVWVAGVPEGARAGVMMWAEPHPGTASYSEGYAPPPFHWTDRGRIAQEGQRTRVPAGSYEDVLVIEEFAAEEPGAFQLKYYARGTGLVRVGWRGQAATPEVLELTARTSLDPEVRAQVRADALALEERASLYSRLAPAEPAPRTEGEGT